MKSIPSFDIPKKMNALMLAEFDTKPELQQTDVPSPGKGEVLIKIDSSPINPSDLSFVRGMYSTKKTLPVIPGFEASGLVVATGNDFMSKRLLGKNVACFAPADGNGTWAEFMVTKSNMAIPLKKRMNLENGSMLLVNPLSVIAMLDIAKKRGDKAIANTAAASALGQMMNQMCMDKNLPIVNIVRREEQVALLKKQGAKHIINSSSSNFKDDLSEAFTKLEVSLAFDAIAGQSANDLLEALPSGGELMVYGGLSEQALSVHAGKLIFEKKKVSGFWLSEWITHQPMLKLLRAFNKIQKYLSDKHEISIHNRVSLANTAAGISEYKENMTAGKILVKPGMK